MNPNRSPNLTKASFFGYILIGTIILLVSAGINYLLDGSKKDECLVYINSNDPTNLIISSNCRVVTTNTISEDVIEE